MLRVFEVNEPGLLTTVVDFGRPGFREVGVPIGGACDRWSLAVANSLLGNPADAAGLECTLLGPQLRALRDVSIAITGADFEAEIRPSGRGVAPSSAVRIGEGEILALGASSEGVRTYIALPGGIDVPAVLGSRTTCLVGGFGGFQGRSLRAGDVLSAARPSKALPNHPRPWPFSVGGDYVRILPGPDATAAVITALTATAWSVSPSSDRRGVRLHGEPISTNGSWGERLTTGVLPGIIQVPPDGQPIVLLADAQPTGGYPVVAVVIEADVGLIGQAAPGASIRFELVSLQGAVAADAASRAAFERWRREVDSVDA